MGMFSWLSGKKGMALDERIKQIAMNIIEKAKNQSWEHKVNITEEAKKIGTSCGILKKTHNPAHFVDIALYLLTYPPELAFSIAIQFSNYQSQLGFNPYGTIMVALSQIDSLYGGMFVRTELFSENPELFEVISSKPKRIQKAGELLTATILGSSESIREARNIYHNNIFDSSVKEVLGKGLVRYDTEIAREII